MYVGAFYVLAASPCILGTVLMFWYRLPFLPGLLLAVVYIRVFQPFQLEQPRLHNSSRICAICIERLDVSLPADGLFFIDPHVAV